MPPVGIVEASDVVEDGGSGLVAVSEAGAVGGSTCCNPEIVDQGAHSISGPIKYRNDFLVYTSVPLEADLEVTGPVVVKQFTSTGRER